MQPAAHRRLRAAPRCGAPEPVKCCSRLPSCVGLGDPQIHPHARVRARSRACSAGRADALDLIELGEALGQRGGAGGDGDQVEILDAVGLAARRAGQAHLGARARQRGQPGHERLARRERLRQQHAGRRALARAVLERRQHAGLELRAEPAHGAQAFVLLPPRAARQASRCPALSAAAARASVPGPAGA